jgi:prepilin peptidase CpaA
MPWWRRKIRRLARFPHGRNKLRPGRTRDRDNAMLLLIDAARLLIFPTVMAFAASSDFFTMTISNRISLILVAGFFALALGIGMSPAEILNHVGAAGLILALGFVFFLRRWIGGGDAKLAAATALWFGWAHLLDYMLYASLLGGALTLALLEFRKLSMPSGLVGRDWAERLHRPGGGVPYGIALAIAALVVYPSTIWMQALSH